MIMIPKKQINLILNLYPSGISDFIVSLYLPRRHLFKPVFSSFINFYTLFLLSKNHCMYLLNGDHVRTVSIQKHSFKVSYNNRA